MNRTDSFSHEGVPRQRIKLQAKGISTMVVRIGCKYSDDWDFSDYEEGEIIRINRDALSANFMILEDEDQDEALDGREGELSKSFDYELHDGQLCAIVDGELVPCENEYEFECYLRRRDGEGA